MRHVHKKKARKHLSFDSMIVVTFAILYFKPIFDYLYTAGYKSTETFLYLILKPLRVRPKRWNLKGATKYEAERLRFFFFPSVVREDYNINILGF